MKLQGMAVVVGRDAESSARQREVLEAIRNNQITLPPGCDVTYETTAIDILDQLLRPTRTEEFLESFYRDFEGEAWCPPHSCRGLPRRLQPTNNRRPIMV